jgi:hypothetical protein
MDVASSSRAAAGAGNKKRRWSVCDTTTFDPAPAEHLSIDTSVTGVGKCKVQLRVFSVDIQRYTALKLQIIVLDPALSVLQSFTPSMTRTRVLRFAGVARTSQLGTIHAGALCPRTFVVPMLRRLPPAVKLQARAYH